MTRNATWHGVQRVLISGGVGSALCFALLGAELAAQQVPQPGSRVRLSTDSIHMGRWITGRYLSLDDHSLRLVSTAGDTLNVPRPALYHLEMSQGRYAHAKAGALVGAVAGAGGAFLMRAIACSQDNRFDRDSDEKEFCVNNSALEVSALGALAGGVLGALLGQVIKSDRWLPVTVERYP